MVFEVFWARTERYRPLVFSGSKVISKHIIFWRIRLVSAKITFSNFNFFQLLPRINDFYIKRVEFREITLNSKIIKSLVKHFRWFSKGSDTVTARPWWLLTARGVVGLGVRADGSLRLLGVACWAERSLSLALLPSWADRPCTSRQLDGYLKWGNLPQWRIWKTEP